MVEGGQLKSAHWGRELQGQTSEQNNVRTLWPKGNVTIPTTINILGVATITASISFKKTRKLLSLFLLLWSFILLLLFATGLASCSYFRASYIGNGVHAEEYSARTPRVQIPDPPGQEHPLVAIRGVG